MERERENNNKKQKCWGPGEGRGGRKKFKDRQLHFVSEAEHLGLLDAKAEGQKATIHMLFPVLKILG